MVVHLSRIPLLVPYSQSISVTVNFLVVQTMSHASWNRQVQVDGTIKTQGSFLNTDSRQRELFGWLARWQTTKNLP